MKNITKILLFIIVGFVAFITLHSWSISGYMPVKSIENPEFIIPIKKQIRSDRDLRQIQLDQKIFTPKDYNEDSDILLYNPLSFEVDNAGNIFVLDFNENVVKKFSPEGSYLLSIGRGQGRGPGEISHLSDFSISPDGSEIWLCDSDASRLSQFDTDGNYIDEKKLEFSPLRVEILNENLIAVENLNAFKHLVNIIDYNGTVLNSFGPVMETQHLYELALQGRINRDSSDEKVIFVSKYGGLILIFDYNLNLLAAKKTIGTPNFPSIVTKKVGGGTSVSLDRSKINTVNRNFFIFNGKIYVNCIEILTSEETPQNYIDIYSAANGDYLYSFDFSNLLSSDIRDLYFSNEYLYILTNTGISKWRYSIE